MTKLRLPLLEERVIAEAKALQVQTGSDYDGLIRPTTSVSCSKGCDNCCHHPFLISILEGVMLYRTLKAQGHWTLALQKRLRETRDKTLGLAFDVWLLSNIPCPLLEDRLCLAYESRPTHCRVTYSIGDPRECHPHELSPKTKILANSHLIMAYQLQVQNMMKKIDVIAPLIPVSEAVLLGADIDNGVFPLEDSYTHYLQDLNV